MMNQVWLLLVLGVTAIGRVAGYQFYWYDETVTFHRARERCAEMGYMLAKADNLDKNQWMATHIWPAKTMEVWIGLERNNEGHFAWDDSEVLSSTWSHWQDQSDSGDCVALSISPRPADDTTNDGWVTRDCSSAKATFFCQDDVTPTELMKAAKTGDVEKVRQLLMEGHEIDAVNKHGMTALQIGAIWGGADVVSELLDFGADIDARNSIGQTALHYAAVHHGGSASVARVLLARGAQYDIQDNQGYTAGTLAEAFGYTALADMGGVCVDATESYCGQMQMTPKRCYLGSNAAWCCKTCRSLSSTTDVSGCEYGDRYFKFGPSAETWFDMACVANFDSCSQSSWYGHTCCQTCRQATKRICSKREIITSPSRCKIVSAIKDD